MGILDKESLFQTLDNLFQAMQEGKKLSAGERKSVASWIASRQNMKGSYANMFAPTDIDYRGIKLLTGDKLTSKASIGHILGEESLRALYLLNIKDRQVMDALRSGASGIRRVVRNNKNYHKGTFCCGKCTAAYWRNISAEGVGKNRSELDQGISYLKKLRDRKGGWRRFPFFYTVLALSGADIPSAKNELKYASMRLKKYLKRKPAGKYEKRKNLIAEKALELI